MVSAVRAISVTIASTAETQKIQSRRVSRGVIVSVIVVTFEAICWWSDCWLNKTVPWRFWVQVAMSFDSVAQRANVVKMIEADVDPRLSQAMLTTMVNIIAS